MKFNLEIATCAQWMDDDNKMRHYGRTDVPDVVFASSLEDARNIIAGLPRKSTAFEYAHQVRQRNPAMKVKRTTE